MPSSPKSFCVLHYTKKLDNLSADSFSVNCFFFIGICAKDRRMEDMKDTLDASLKISRIKGVKQWLLSSLSNCNGLSQTLMKQPKYAALKHSLRTEKHLLLQSVIEQVSES